MRWLRCWLSLGHNWVEVGEQRYEWQRVEMPPWIVQETHTCRSPLWFCARCGKTTHQLRVPDWIIGEFTWQPERWYSHYGGDP